MADRFLHGIELIEIEDGGRTVRTVKSSVIGLVGTAPDAAPARHATLTVGTGDASFTVRAKQAGIVGNSLRLELRPATAPNQPLSITLDTRTPGMTLILVTLASDATGQRVSTAQEVVAALNADEAASALITAEVAEGTGAGMVEFAADRRSHSTPATPSLSKSSLISAAVSESATQSAVTVGGGVAPTSRTMMRSPGRAARQRSTKRCVSARVCEPWACVPARPGRALASR